MANEWLFRDVSMRTEVEVRTTIVESSQVDRQLNACYHFVVTGPLSYVLWNWLLVTSNATMPGGLVPNSRLV